MSSWSSHRTPASEVARGSSGGPAATAGGHTPVLAEAVLAWLLPARRIVDGTVGAGGHSEALLAGGAERVLGLDVDAEALQLAAERLAPWGERAALRQGSYCGCAGQRRHWAGTRWMACCWTWGFRPCSWSGRNGAFALRRDGPLDMRFDPGSGIADAASIVNGGSEEALAGLFRRYGEERHSRRLARMIVRERPFGGTQELAQAIERARPRARRERIHPATRVFQALRIAVNEELETLQRALPEALATLRPGGRLAVISFHSLEDRIVKRWMQAEERDCVCPPRVPVCGCEQRARLRRLTRRPLVADDAEREGNPRSRSAKLRVAEKL